jgi:putative ATP-dependent endonuclease of OLD family
LVEGPTEALALPVLLAKVGLHLFRLGIAVVPVRGVGSIAKWWRLFSAYKIPQYVMIDRDSKDDRDGKKRREVFQVLDLSEETVKHLEQANSSVAGERLALMVEDYESGMRSLFDPQYSSLEEEARDTLSLSGEKSKPLVARYVADKLDVSSSKSGLKWLQDLAQRIQAVGNCESTE